MWKSLRVLRFTRVKIRHAFNKALDAFRNLPYFCLLTNLRFSTRKVFPIFVVRRSYKYHQNEIRMIFPVPDVVTKSRADVRYSTK